MAHDKEKTHHDCKCRDCEPLTAFAERMDAWKAAESVLFSRQWHEEILITPDTVAGLANWLLYGPEDDD